MKNVFVIILNFNGEENTIQCLKSVEKLQITRSTGHSTMSSDRIGSGRASYKLQIVVVDNGSKKKFKVQSSKFKVIRSEENLGFAGGNNVGIRYALKHGASHIVVLNNDTIVDPNLINELVKAADKDPKIGIIAPKIYFARGFEFHKNRYKKEELGRVFWYGGGVMDWKNVIGRHLRVDELDHGQYEKQEETDFASGCCMLIKREVLERVGFFDERYFLYYEDSDLCQRVKRAGYKIIYAPKAILWHKNAASAQGAGSGLQDYYITRNRLIFGMRFAPLRAKIALIRESLDLLAIGRLWQKRGVIDFYLRRFGKGTYEI